MEIVTSLPTGATGASGGAKKHVEEWSRLDRLTGMLEHARVEADHWASNTSNSRHHFGQVVDSRARNLADGSVQQKQQTKQLEVFQAHIPGGSVQVIRSHTSTTSSWHNSKVLQNKSHVDWPSSISDKLLHRMNKMDASMDDLKLHHNMVNLNSERTKASVARLLPSRRPPTRSRFSKTNDDDIEDDFFANIPRICHNAHVETEKRLEAIAKDLKFSLAEEVSGDFENGVGHLLNGAATGIETLPVDTDTCEHERLEKKKSISDENLSIIDEKENSDPWKRNSKTRWSFQHPRTTKFKEERTSKGTGEFESPKCELEAVLAKVLRRKGENLDKYAKPVKEEEEGEKKSARQQEVATKPSPATSSFPKRRSFVTEETLKQTKQRLRHLNGAHDFAKTTESVGGVKNDAEETDDGICTGSKGNSDREDEKDEKEESPIPRLDQPHTEPDQRTGSLESRTKNKSDDWFDRRKSYGFEPVHAHQRYMAKGACESPKTTNLSTDSGICRSSELELVSTPIVKKLVEATSNVDDEEEDLQYQRETSVSRSGDVAQLMKKFENKLEPRAIVARCTAPATTVVTLTNEEPKIRILDARKGKVLEAIKSLRESSVNATAFEPASSIMKSCSRPPAHADDADLPTNTRSKNALLDDDILSKRHSIACEDAKYMIAKFSGLERAFQEKPSNLSSSSSLSSEPLNTTVVNVNNFEGSPDVVSGNDAKKPKKVEFSKTEVHFAAAEPGKIKIVETNEKPPPTNLYRRKKRSVSLSPKIGLSRSKFAGVDGKGMNDNARRDDPFDSRGTDATATNDALGAAISDQQRFDQTARDKFANNSSRFTSSTSDNGLAVRISSTQPEDFRRASWSVVDPSENKAGYSTKINFGKEGVTIVADAKSQKYEKSRTAVDSSYNSKSSSLDASRNDENFQEKLIVRIGGCGRNATSTKYVQNRFTNSFRNSVYGSCSSSSSSSGSAHKDVLKSTSLIIDTIKRSSAAASKSTNVRIANANNVRDDFGRRMEKKISALRRNEEEVYERQRKEPPVEQPSTYITEMNRLQRGYRVRVNRSAASGDEKICKTPTSRIYNTVPGAKNRPKAFANDLPSVLNAFDRLHRSIDRAIDENRKLAGIARTRSVGGTSSTKLTLTSTKSSTAAAPSHHFDKLSTRVYGDETSETLSSHSWFLNQVASRHDGNVSDDSLKADEEVRSYMSTAIMEEYENELSGSWSRRRYFKHIKPVKTIKEDEIPEKSHHFKPLRSEEEKLKTVNGHANIVDIKRPKITSVAVNVKSDGADSWHEDKSFKKCTTVLLNNENENANIEGGRDDREARNSIPKFVDERLPAPAVAFANDDVSARVSAGTNEDALSAAPAPCPRNDESLKLTTTRAKPNPKFEDDYKAVRVIHHQVRLPLPEKESSADRRRMATIESRRKEAPKVRSTTTTNASTGTPLVARKTVPSKDSMIANHGAPLRSSSRRSNTQHGVVDKDRLFDTGRDGWLNLPKERKYAADLVMGTKARPTNSSSHLRKSTTATAAVVYKEERHGSSRSPKLPIPDVMSTTTTYTDASSEDDGCRRNAYRSQRLSKAKPLTTISERTSLKADGDRCVSDTTTSRTIANASNSKAPVARTTSNSSLESRSNSYEFKIPILKTEERSKRRAARMLQRATSREALMKAQAANVSSSEDITSENEVGCLRTGKSKTTRKTKSPKLSKLSQPATNAIMRSKYNRVIQQKTAKMEINIFRIKEKPNDKKVYNYSHSRSYPANNATVTKTQSQRGRREISANAYQKGSICRPAASNSNNNKKSESNSMNIGTNTTR